MSTLHRRRFLVLAAAGVVAVAGGGIGLIVHQLQEGRQKSTRTFRAMTGLPAKPLLSYATYVITGTVNVESGIGTITRHVYAGPPENMTDIPLFKRNMQVTGVRQQGPIWHISGVVATQAQLQKGEESSFQLQLDPSSGVAQSTFFGSPIQLQLQAFS